MTKAQVTGDQSTSNTGTESSGRKKQDYLVVSVLERIAGRNNLWDEIINLNLFVVKSLVLWQFVVGLLSNYTHTSVWLFVELRGSIVIVKGQLHLVLVIVISGW